MNRRSQLAYVAAFAAAIVLSLLLVRPRGPAGASPATARSDASANPSAVAPATAVPIPTPAPPRRATATPPRAAKPAGRLTATLTVSKPPAPAAAPVPSPGSAVADAGGATQAPPLTGAVSGAVRDARGEGLGAVSVVAVSADGHDAAETLTDDDGSFLLPGLLPGRYAVFTGLGTPLAARIGGRGVEVRPASVARIDLLEPSSGTVVRVAPHDASGQPADAQAVLVAGAPSATGAVGSLLASDAIYLPELGQRRTVLPRVPPGVYTLVLLRGADVPVRAARNPVRISSEREVVVDIVVASAATPRG